MPVVGLVDGCMLGSGWILTSLKFGREIGVGDIISVGQAKQATGQALCLRGPGFWIDFVQLF